MNPSRWQWVTRPRWAVVLIAGSVLVGWGLWPIELHEVVGANHMFEIRLPDSSRRYGESILVMPGSSAPWKVGEIVAEVGASHEGNTRVDDLGDQGFWVEPDPGQNVTERILLWRRGNVIFSLSARKIGEHEPGHSDWMASCERIARETDAVFLDGKAGGRVVRLHRLPRAWVIARMARDDWQREQGKEPVGWW